MILKTVKCLHLVAIIMHNRRYPDPPKKIFFLSESRWWASSRPQTNGLFIGLHSANKLTHQHKHSFTILAILLKGKQTSKCRQKLQYCEEMISFLYRSVQLCEALHHLSIHYILRYFKKQALIIIIHNFFPTVKEESQSFQKLSSDFKRPCDLGEHLLLVPKSQHPPMEDVRQRFAHPDGLRDTMRPEPPHRQVSFNRAAAGFSSV